MMEADFERLFADYRGKVFAYIRSRVNSREEAEDLCSDVFEKALRSAEKFDASKASVGTWLYSITRNTVIDFYRRSRPTAEMPDDLSDVRLPEDGLLEAELLEELAAALERLPDELTDIIVYHYYDRMPLTEIADNLGVSYGAVKIRHQKALAILKTALG